MPWSIDEHDERNWKPSCKGPVQATGGVLRRLRRRFFGPPEKGKIDALGDNIENFSTRLHAISTTLKLDISNAVINAKIEAPFQQRYFDLVKQQTEAETRYQGSGWNQESLNREIREIADRRWEVERLREEIGSSAAKGFELFQQPKKQDLGEFEQRLTKFETNVHQAAERNQLLMRAAQSLVEGDNLLRGAASALDAQFREGQSRREGLGIDENRESQEIRNQRDRANNLLSAVQNRIRSEGAHLVALETSLADLIRKLGQAATIAEGNREGIRRPGGSRPNAPDIFSGMVGELSERPLPAYEPERPQTPAGAVVAQAKSRSATPESTSRGSVISR
jgi:hypothetical protein